MKKYNLYMISILILSITLSIVSKFDSFSHADLKNDILSGYNKTSNTKLLAYLDNDFAKDDVVDYIDTLYACEYKDSIMTIDVTAPTIKCKKSLTTTQGKKINLLKSVQVSDDSDDEVEVSVQGDYDINTIGKYQLKYVAVDSSKNVTEQPFTLIVKEKVTTTAVVTQPVETPQTIPPVSGDTRQRIVQIALSQVGNVNGNPYWSWYGFSGRVEWCACFVSWVANQAGVLNNYIPKFAGTGVGVRWFKSKGQWRNRSYVPQAGDVIFFDYAHNGRVEHVGLVQKVENGRVYTIEGNTNRNMVENRSYPQDSLSILGYGVPTY